MLHTGEEMSPNKFWAILVFIFSSYKICNNIKILQCHDIFFRCDIHFHRPHISDIEHTRSDDQICLLTYQVASIQW